MKSVTHSPNEPEVISRIVDLLIQQGKSQTELLVYLGLNRNNLTEWKARRNRSYLMYIDEIAQFFDVTPTYLLRGEEFSQQPAQDEQMTEREQVTEQEQLTENEMHLIKSYRSLSDEAKEKLMVVLTELEER